MSGTAGTVTLHPSHAAEFMLVRLSASAVAPLGSQDCEVLAATGGVVPDVDLDAGDVAVSAVRNLAHDK